MAAEYTSGNTQYIIIFFAGCHVSDCSWLPAHRLILSFELETENIGEGCSHLLLPPHGRGEACKWVGAPLKTSTFLVVRKWGRGITPLFSASPWPGIWVGAGNTLASVRFWFVGCSGSWHRGPIWVCRGEACKGWAHPSKLERFVVWERGGGISPPFSASPRPWGLRGAVNTLGSVRLWFIVCSGSLAPGLRNPT